MPITCLFDELRDVAKIQKSDVKKLIQLGKVNWQLEPLSVDREFFEDLKDQTEEQKGLENLLYFREAANLITMANATKLKIDAKELKYAVANGLFIDQRLVDEYRYWVYGDNTVEIEKDAIFHYKLKEENIGLPLLKRQAVEELIEIFRRYEGIHILRKPPQKRGLQKRLISHKQFIEKYDPEKRIGANIEGYPLVFICGEKGEKIVYIEESKEKPTSSYCSDYDSKRIKFASSHTAWKFLEVGLKDWSRIARYECNNRNYATFFFQLDLNNRKAFLANFLIHLSLIIDRYLDENDYKLLNSTMQELLSERGTHSGINNPEERFPKLIGLYKKYRKLVYKP